MGWEREGVVLISMGAPRAGIAFPYKIINNVSFFQFINREIPQMGVKCVPARGAPASELKTHCERVLAALYAEMSHMEFPNVTLMEIFLLRWSPRCSHDGMEKYLLKNFIQWLFL